MSQAPASILTEAVYTEEALNIAYEDGKKTQLAQDTVTLDKLKQRIALLEDTLNSTEELLVKALRKARGM
jgi:hypothetical protein